jgi:hypothetical protein
MKHLFRASPPFDGGMQVNFAQEQSGGATETEGVRKLKHICTELPSRPGAVKDLLAALQDEEPDKISTYEFLSSGAVSELSAYLQGKSVHLWPWNIRREAASVPFQCTVYCGPVPCRKSDSGNSNSLTFMDTGLPGAFFKVRSRKYQGPAC